jgi:peptidoglycan/LPS O-acetylase OafA/YrhL
VKNLKYIDALRGIAVLGVLMVHCSKFGANNYPFLLSKIFDNGAMGVQLFYVVSAFTLFLSVSFRSKNEKNPNRNFFIRRFFRIAPLYYLAVLYYLYQDGTGPRLWLGDMNHISTANIASNFFFSHGINPYWINSIVPGGWSVSVEMFFYCLVPFLASHLKNLNSAVLFFGITLALKSIFDFVLTTFPLRPI